jgi:hypothetical protein
MKKIITKKIKMLKFPEKLKKQYCHNNQWSKTTHGEVEPIYNIAKKLNKEENFDIENYKKEIKHFAPWIDITCGNCNKKVEKAIEIGWNYDYDVPALIVCKKCLEESLSKLDK